MTPEEKIEFLKIMIYHEIAIHDMVDHADWPLEMREKLIEEYLKFKCPEVFM